MPQHLLFNKQGTLLTLTLGGHEIIYPYHEIEKNSRGGLFWCLPNFDTEIGTFSLRHGEYRKTEGSIFGETHHKIIAGPWGTLETEALWEKSETSLTASVFLTAKKGETFIRPGIHPYFTTENLVKIVCGTESFILPEIPQNKMTIFTDNTSHVELFYKNMTVVLHLTHNSVRTLSQAIVIWTDNISSYVCVENCLGLLSSGNQELPTHVALKKGESLSLTYTVSKKTI